MRQPSRSALARVVVVWAVLSVQFDVSHVRSWGSFSTTPTHQNIFRLAYEQLKADPAFDPAKFPALDAILSNEGVTWTGAGESVTTPGSWLTGPGPDSEGATDYSEHYYNSRLPEGGAPASIAKNFVWLSKGIYTGVKGAHAKAAAWGAHFLSDVFVPFHVNGASTATVRADYNAQGGASAPAIALRAEVSGPLDLCYGCASNPHGGDFKTEVERGLAVTQPYVDWLDPWYYNGNWPATAKTSSHMVWEGTVSGPSSYSPSGFDPGWKNGSPSFTDPWKAQSTSAKEMAEAAGVETASLVTGYYANANPALNRAVQSVYTFWRAAISALKPGFEATPVEGEDGVYEVKATVENVAGESAADIQMQIAIEGGSVVFGSNPQAVGDAPAKAKSPSATWKIKTADPAKCQVKIEACGSYTRTPDLQYASVTEPLPGPVGPLDLCFCIDLTGSMSDDIGKVKSSTAAIINAIASKTKDFRVAVLGYRDWPEEKPGSSAPPMFQDYPFTSDREAIIANISALDVSGGGDEPEAVLEALMRAIEGKSVGPWRNGVNKQIILMGDAPPHDPSKNGLTAAIVAKAAEDADPIVIQAIAIGNSGSFNAKAVESFGNLSKLTGGKLFQAADAEAVPKAVMATIRTLSAPLGVGQTLWSKYKTAIVIGGGCFFLLLVTVVVVLLCVRGKRSRNMQKRAQHFPAPPPYGPSQTPTWPPTPSPGMGAQPYTYDMYGPTSARGYPLQQPAPPRPEDRLPAGFRQTPVPPPGDAFPGVAPPPRPAAEVCPPPPARTYFEVAKGVSLGAKFPLSIQSRIGRAPDNDIVLMDPKASSHHAVVTRVGKAFMIADLGSTNGTTVNGAKVGEAAPLSDGFVIGVGNHLLVFHSET